MIFFTNTIDAQTTQLYSCVETHEVALGLKVFKGESGAPEQDNGVCRAQEEAYGTRGMQKG
jgi:hypothetical protein